MLHATQLIGHAARLLYLFVFPNDIPKTDAARITKLDVEMFHHEYWKFVYFGGQGHEAQRTLLVWVIALS